MFERKHEKLLSRREFFRRLAKYALVSLGLVIVSLLIGMLDYSQYKGLSTVVALDLMSRNDK